MQNEVTVRLSLPWMNQLSGKEYHDLYKDMARIAKDDSNTSSPAANRMLSALTVRKDIYSYQDRLLDVDFKAYEDLSRCLPGQELKFRVGKAGKHIHTGTVQDVNYYNGVDIVCRNGQTVSQTLGHMDSMEDSELRDTVKLTGSHMCLDLLSMKVIAVQAAGSHVKKPTLAMPDLQTEQMMDFSL